MVNLPVWGGNARCQRDRTAPRSETNAAHRWACSALPFAPPSVDRDRIRASPRLSGRKRFAARGASDERASGNRPGVHRQRWVGRHSGRRPRPRSDVSLRGRPGTGKTTIALQFLLDGAKNGERVLFVSLSETERELELVAQRHGWSLDGIDVFELVPAETTLDPAQQVTVFHPAEMELSETINLIFERVAQADPTRIVIDSLSELRLLAQNPLRYRRQVLALKHFFAKAPLHGDPARRPDVGAERPAAAFDLPRRRAAGAAGDRLRGRAAAPARGQDARHPVPRRLSRFYHRIRRLADLPAAGRGRASCELRRGGGAQRQRRPGRAARRRAGARHQRSADRGGRRRQVVAGDHLCHRGGATRRTRGDLRLRRGARHGRGPRPHARPAARRNRGIGTGPVPADRPGRAVAR